VKTARYVVLVVLAASLALGGFGYVVKTRRTVAQLEEELLSAKASQKSLLEGKLKSARTGDVRVQGKIEAAEAVAVSPQVEAPIAAVLIVEGDIVDAGQVLVTLDDTGLRADLESCTGAMNRAARQLADIERLYPQRDALYHEAVEDVELTHRNTAASFRKALTDSERDIAMYEAEVAAKRLEVARTRALASDELIAKADLEQAELGLRCTELEAEAAKARHIDLRRRVPVAGDRQEYIRLREAELVRQQRLRQAEEDRITDEDLAQARAALEECRLMAHLAEDHVAAAEVKAPIRGIVTAANDSPRLTSVVGTNQLSTGRSLSFEELREVGKRVGPQDILFVIEGLDTVVVKVDVDEMDINRIKVGDPARITGVGFSNMTLRGEVAAISPKATYVAEGITTFETTVNVLEELGAARLGMSAEVDIVVGGE
jgi:membrane fusion protein, adhesin transport system